jgi:hypothetical protein
MVYYEVHCWEKRMDYVLERMMGIERVSEWD